MSGFDDAFAFADEAAFNAMGEDERGEVFRKGIGAPIETRVITSPEDVSGEYRRGGRQPTGVSVFEVEAGPLLESGVQDGWKFRFKNREYRIEAVTWQGGTAVLACSGGSDSSGGL